MLINNLFALIITFLATLFWLRIWDYAANKNWVQPDISRKIIHIGTGPIFVACWLLFPKESISRYLASLVPLMFTLQFLLIGLGVIHDEASVKAMSRTGDRREILHGPLYYGIIFVLLTILYWYDNPIGIVALMLLCGGDGLADIFGRRYGKRKLPWNMRKSWLGSTMMFLGGWLLSIIMVVLYVYVGIFNGSVNSYLFAITLVALIATFVESLPLHDIDNITITLSAIIFGRIFFS